MINKGHPKGLGVLFTTEMWERFNFTDVSIAHLIPRQRIAFG